MPKLPELTVGAAARHGSVTVLPVFAEAALPPADYDLGAAALAEGWLEIRELPGGATVGHLQARNHGRRRVLLVDGDHLIGAKQNRILTSSVLVGAHREVKLPVSCVERGRWEDSSARFAGHAASNSPRLRRIARLTVTRALFTDGRRAADQSQIWNQVATQQRSLRVSSATSSLAHTYAARATDLGEARSRLPYPTGAIGVAIGVGAELVSVDLFDRPETCQRYWQRLIEGAALDGLAAAPSAEGIGGGAVMRLLEELRGASWSTVAAVGDGDELRVQTPSAAASLLIVEGRIVHFGAATGPAPGATVDSRVAVMRHDLPEHLAARYRIVSRIGLGGTKEVFCAVDTHGGPEVAIARIPCVDRDRFNDEVALARRVQSDHVPKVIEAHVDAYGDGYLVMERCDGPTLAQLVDGRPLSVADAAPILVAFARGLEAVHRVAVLHRDIKLENVMLSSGTAVPKLKILDFGLSRQAVNETSAVFDLRELAGTAPYMAREIVDGADLDARTDVYAFGVCCFRMLTGEFPTPPRADESEHQYLGRVGRASGDLSRLPAALPEPVRAMIGRMLSPDRERRPYMPEVVAVLEQTFGAPPLAPPPRAAALPRPLPLARAARVAVSVASPDHVLVAECAQAPLVTLAPEGGTATCIRAIAPSGETRWTRRLDGPLVTGIRADLDGDGVREIYVAGTGSVVGLSAAGAVRFTHPIVMPSAPTLLGLTDRVAPGLAVDGRMLDVATGTVRGRLAFSYRGDGHQLVATEDLRGVSYNGIALQGFCGDHGTAAAVVHHPGDHRFVVAQLEDTRSGRVQIGIYGPGGVRLHALVVADAPLDTGDTSAIIQIYHRRAPLFGPLHAPIAVLGAGKTAAVIVPLLDPSHGLPPTLVSFELPSGRELWRCRPEAAGGRALLADLDGSGRPQLVVGDGRALVAYDPWTGHASAPLPCKGLPVAYGDPLATGFLHLITAGSDGIELWRGARCRPGAMAWTGARGDLWRTGTLRSDGTPLGPV